MRKWMTILAVAFAAAACGSDGGPSGPELLDGFDPPSPTVGQVQLLTPIIDGIQPGTDRLFCTYLDYDDQAGFDIIDYQSYQSAFNHHSILYASSTRKPAGTHECTEEDMITSRYLGGGGGDSPPQYLSPGVAFRVEPDAQLMIQTHWINSTDAVIQGQAAFNLTVQPQSTSVQPAGLFSVANTQFALAPGPGAVRSECVMAQDMTVALLGGHEHEHGTHVTITVTPPGGAPQVLYETEWKPEYEFNPPRNAYTIDAPLTLHAGDTLALDCDYVNDSTDTIRFPSEMCVIFAYYFPAEQGEIDCVDGSWPQ